MTIFPASLTTLICKTPFAMTSHNGRLAPKQSCRHLQDVTRPTGCVSIRSFSSSTLPAHQAATVTAIMVSLHFRLPSQYFFAFSSVFYSYYSMCFCSLLYDALWLGRDTLWPEQFTLWLGLGRDALWPQQFTLWLGLGRDALWPQQFTKSRHTSSCFLCNANTEARGCYAKRDYMYGGD